MDLRPSPLSRRFGLGPGRKDSLLVLGPSQVSAVCLCPDNYNQFIIVLSRVPGVVHSRGHPLRRTSTPSFSYPLL